MASLPAQVIYAPPLTTMQERLPSIRDLDFPVRPPRPHQSQSQSQSQSQPQSQPQLYSQQQQLQQQQQQSGEPSSSSSQSHSSYGRGRAQTTSWPLQATTMPPPSSPASTSGYGGPLSAPPTNTGIPLPTTVHSGGAHSRDDFAGMQDSHTQSRQRSESRASTTARSSMSPSTSRIPHTSYLPRQYSAQHGAINYSSIPPSPHQAHLQHTQHQHQHQLPPSPSTASSSGTTQAYHQQGPPNYAPIQPGPQPGPHSGYASYQPHYAPTPPHVHQPTGPVTQPHPPAPSPTGLSPVLYHQATDHWQHQGLITHTHSHSSGHSSPHNTQQQNQLPPQQSVHLQQQQQHSHSHHQHSSQVHQSPHQSLQQLQQQPLSQSQPHAFHHTHESTLGGVTDISPSTGEASRPPDTAHLSEQFSTGNKIEMRQNYLKEIKQNCYVIVRFSDHYHQASVTSPHIQPDPEELAEMRQKAELVVSLLEELRKLSLTDEGTKKEADAVSLVPAEGRPPKRPWEDMLDENEIMPSQIQSFSSGGNSQTMAEKDMAIIRSKRATNPTNIPTDAPKGKYRKRSRASPPGKCHSCHIRETPEWRRGPDGARTLCNACGLHYAKLMRKREKAGPDGRLVHIDLETLRASTRLANEKEKTQSSIDTATTTTSRQKRQQESGDEQPTPSPEQRQRDVSPPGNSNLQSPSGVNYLNTPSTVPSGLAPQNLLEAVGESAPTNVPSSTWSNNQSSRGYSSEQQSYMRNTPSNSRSSLS